MLEEDVRFFLRLRLSRRKPQPLARFSKDSLKINQISTYEKWKRKWRNVLHWPREQLLNGSALGNHSCLNLEVEICTILSDSRPGCICCHVASRADVHRPKQRTRHIISRLTSGKVALNRQLPLARFYQSGSPPMRTVSFDPIWKSTREAK